MNANGVRCEEDDAKHEANRARMLCEQSWPQFETASAWLETVQTTKAINRRITSYGLKHVVEGWARHGGLAHDCESDIFKYGYVSNGMFICAAVRLGFKIEVIPCTPNVWINVSSKSLPKPGKWI